MLLRNHPLTSCRGVPSWPPKWTWLGGLENKHLQGEIGTLKAAQPSNVLPADRCFLYIDHEGSSYIGCLLFADHAFCAQVVKLLQRCCSRSIAEIGSSEGLPHSVRLRGRNFFFQTWLEGNAKAYFSEAARRHWRYAGIDL
jgi:hypothetical protein